MLAASNAAAQTSKMSDAKAARAAEYAAKLAAEEAALPEAEVRLCVVADA